MVSTSLCDLEKVRLYRAGEGTRTLDIQLGKLALCQLSYARNRNIKAIRQLQHQIRRQIAEMPPPIVAAAAAFVQQKPISIGRTPHGGEPPHPTFEIS
jgi:hypothetical protein